MTLPQMYLVLLTGGTVLLASIAAARMASRLGLPSLLLFLGVGVVLGEDVLGLHFDDAQVAQTGDPDQPTPRVATSRDPPIHASAHTTEPARTNTQTRTATPVGAPP